METQVLDLRSQLVAALINVFKANEEHRGMCATNLIRMSTDRVNTLLNAIGYEWEDDSHIIKILREALTDERIVSEYGGEWLVELADNDETIQLYELPDNWVYVDIDFDGTVEKAFYV